MENNLLNNNRRKTCNAKNENYLVNNNLSKIGKTYWVSFTLIIFSGILLINGVFALGITPARTTINFAPGLEQDVSFTIVNSEHKDINLVVYAAGELNQSVFISESLLEMKANDEAKEIKYKVKLPLELKPGLNTAEIVVLEVPSGVAGIGGVVGVATQLHVLVPYPGKYAEAELNIISGEEVTFVIPVISRGKVDLVSVKVNVDIYNAMGEKIDSFNTAEISLSEGERKEIVHVWKKDVPPGRYRGVITLIYDGNTIDLGGEFNVGSVELELQQIEVRDFKLGEIAKFEMLIENKWSDVMSGVYTETEVFNNDGEVMADFKSPTYELEPLSKEILISYWDTGGVHKGSYDASVYLRYGEKSSQKDVRLDVYEDRIDIIGLGFVISERGSKGNNLVIMLVISIGVLVLINLAWFLWIRKKLQEKVLKS